MMACSKQGSRYLSKWLLITALPLSVQPSSTYSIINAEDELLPNPEATNKHEMHEVSRRGFAGGDFYAKASKSIPRIGRRSETEANNCICKPFAEYESEVPDSDITPDAGDFEQSQIDDGTTNKMKRLSLVQEEMSAWPWFTDRVPNTAFKRTESNEKCYYIPKEKNYFSSHEICNEDLICCLTSADSPILKRFVATYSNKQTTTAAPDYKSNRFM